MRNIIKVAAIAAVVSAAAFIGKPPAALAAVQDGSWSVLIVTDKGGCDRGYRYDVKIANGHVVYEGTAPVHLAGTVEPSGLVQVSIKAGDKGANGSGRLTASAGAGTWRGIGGSTACSGHWEAERR